MLVLLALGAALLLYLYAGQGQRTAAESMGLGPAGVPVGVDGDVIEGDLQAGLNVVQREPVRPTQADFNRYAKFGGWIGPYDSAIWCIKQISWPAEDAVLVKAICFVESSFNPNASRQEPRVQDESIGLMQLRTDTARWLMGWQDWTRDAIAAELRRPEQALHIGFKYLAYQRHRYRTRDREKLAAAYNAGSIIKRRITGDYMNRGYVDKVLAAAAKFSDDFPAG